MLTSAVHVLCVVPARIGSTRLAQKPLRLIAGEPLIRHVARRVAEFDLGLRVVVATDDPRVADAAAGPPPGGPPGSPAVGGGAGGVMGGGVGGNRGRGWGLGPSRLPTSRDRRQGGGRRAADRARGRAGRARARIAGGGRDRDRGGPA